MRIKFWLEHVKGRVYSEDLGVEERIILERILGMHPAQDRNQWRALFNMVINLRIP
jgi:hypothetical protein